MNRLVAVIGAFAACVLAPQASAQDQGWFGSWESTRGKMHVEQDGGEVRGDYETMGGRFRGHIEDGGLSGVWSQSFSRQRCRHDRMGSEYWGHFRLYLSDDGRYFHGRWSYCDSESGNGEEWNGKRPRHRRHH